MHNASYGCLIYNQKRNKCVYSLDRSWNWGNSRLNTNSLTLQVHPLHLDNFPQVYTGRNNFVPPKCFDLSVKNCFGADWKWTKPRVSLCDINPSRRRGKLGILLWRAETESSKPMMQFAGGEDGQPVFLLGRAQPPLRFVTTSFCICAADEKSSWLEAHKNWNN